METKKFSFLNLVPQLVSFQFSKQTLELKNSISRNFLELVSYIQFFVITIIIFFLLLATSLCEAESAEKYVGILHIKGKQFKMEEIKLKTVRPMIFKNISLFEETPDFKPPFTKDCTEEKDIQSKVYDAIIEYVEKVLRDDLPGKDNFVHLYFEGQSTNDVTFFAIVKEQLQST